MDPSQLLPFLLGTAVLIPLMSFFVIFIGGGKWMGKGGIYAAWVSILAIGFSGFCSFAALVVWLANHGPHAAAHGEHESLVAADSFSNVDAPRIVRGQDDKPHTEAKSAKTNAADTEKSHGEPANLTHPAPATEHGSHAGHSHGKPTAYSGDFNVPGLGAPWMLGHFGNLTLSISYYIDALTVCMFAMVTFIATLIHIYASGYMHDELHEITDHEVTVSSGEHLRRPGRYQRFFQYLSLFCFSMLGLVIAGNIAMVFVFWELVGICSYFLIGFYVERKSATNAANKAFIVNRVGDFGMIIGLLALWTSLGTFSFGDTVKEGHVTQAGIFSQVRSEANHHQLVTPDGMVLLSAHTEVSNLLRDLGPSATPAAIKAAVAAKIPDWRDGKNPAQNQYGYCLLIVAGIGIFTGCVGKSAQFPLHVWLPDAMEGPTPVSALVHSATMVAAGVYLVGRFYPVFAPEVLLVIAVIGCITLFLAATIAITANDIKRVLAYSTVSQLGYMMMALGIGGWLAGMMHLITHAFFKSLLFMCSGSVIHAVHTNDMREMGGLRQKMPATAYTMLVGCFAIAGAGLPFIIGLLGGDALSGLGFSGFYSKDAILEQAYSFMKVNPSAWAGTFFLVSAGGAAITAFYMFRMWYMTFAGKPRNAERYHHAHESPVAMYAPLLILAVMAVSVAWSPWQGLIGGFTAFVVFLIAKLLRKPGEVATDAHGHGHTTHTHAAQNQEHDDHHGHDQDDHGHATAHDHGGGGLGWLPLADVPLAASLVVFFVAGFLYVANRDISLSGLLESARPTGTLATTHGVLLDRWIWPNEHDGHAAAIAIPVTMIAIGTAFAGFLLATMMYGLGRLNPDEVRKQFQSAHRLLVNKWWFDELYDAIFIRPTHILSRFISGIDRSWIDWIIDGLAAVTRAFSVLWDRVADRTLVDGLFNLVGNWTYSLGLTTRVVQTGKLRQYVMFIVIGAVAIFVLISLWNSSLAG